jgi:hypothetical protein
MISARVLPCPEFRHTRNPSRRLGPAGAAAGSAGAASGPAATAAAAAAAGGSGPPTKPPPPPPSAGPPARRCSSVQAPQLDAQQLKLLRAREAGARKRGALAAAAAQELLVEEDGPVARAADAEAVVADELEEVVLEARHLWGACARGPGGEGSPRCLVWTARFLLELPGALPRAPGPATPAAPRARRPKSGPPASATPRAKPARARTWAQGYTLREGCSWNANVSPLP